MTVKFGGINPYQTTFKSQIKRNEKIQSTNNTLPADTVQINNDQKAKSQVTFGRSLKKNVALAGISFMSGTGAALLEHINPGASIILGAATAFMVMLLAK